MSFLTGGNATHRKELSYFTIMKVIYIHIYELFRIYITSNICYVYHKKVRPPIVSKKVWNPPLVAILFSFVFVFFLFAEIRYFAGSQETPVIITVLRRGGRIQ